MVAVGYVRRSKASDVRTVSLEEQRAQIEAYCQTQGWTLAEVVTDDGVSGGKRIRLERLADAVKASRAGRVCVYHLDRFARDVAAVFDALTAMDRRGVELHVPGRGLVEARSSDGRLRVGVEALMDDVYRVRIGEKTRHALARLRDGGRRYSHVAPYGWAFDHAACPGGPHKKTGTCRLAPVPAERAALAALQALAAKGLSLRACSRELAARGWVNRNGRPFAFQALARMVGRLSTERLLDAAAAAGAPEVA